MHYIALTQSDYIASVPDISNAHLKASRHPHLGRSKSPVLVFFEGRLIRFNLRSEEGGRVNRLTEKNEHGIYLESFICELHTSLSYTPVYELRISLFAHMM